MATINKDHLPGAFPESNPATPDEQGLAPQNQSYIQGHDQRNKLHKSADPRTHAFSNAPLGNIEPHPLENKSDISQRRFYGSQGEAVGGGFYNHGNDPTLFNSNHPRVSEHPQPRLSMENPDREPGFDQHEYTFAKPGSTIPKEQNLRDVDNRPIPEQGFRGAESRPEVVPHSEPRRESAGTSSQGADEQLSNIGEKSSNDDATSRSSDTSAAAPYWGDLPKASQGGIYNTVTGHGSARDDHDEHHHLPQRSAEDSSDDTLRITDLRTDIPVPSGGVYNTVAGHGSNDEEMKRHLDERTNDSNTLNNNNLKVNIPEPGHGGTTINSTDAVFDAPLAAVPEDKPLTSNDLSQAPSAGMVTGTDRKDIAPGFLPETAAGDDAKLLAESAAKRKERAGSTDNTNVFDAHTSTGPGAHDSNVKTQRVFPLTSHHATTTDATVPKEDADQHPLRHKEAFAAGAAGLGAGALAKKHHDDKVHDARDRENQKNLGEDTLSKEWDTVPENLDHPARNHPSGGAAAAVSHRRKSQELSEAGVIPISGSTLEKMKTKEEEKPLGEDTLDVWDTTPENLQKPASHHHANAAAVQQPATEHHRLTKEPSPAESRSSEDDSSKGEKKHRGGLLGIFHRHKDDKEEDTTTTEHKDDGRNKLQKKNVPAAVAAGTGAAAGYGLGHHHKDKDAENQRKSFSGPSTNQPNELDQKRRASEAAPVSHRRSPTDAQSGIPPVPAVGAVSTNAPSHGLSQTQREQAPPSKIPVAADQHDTHDRLNQNTARAGMAGAALAGVAGGIGAAKYASSEDNSKTIHPEQQNVVHANTGAPAAAGTGPVTSGGLYHTENPRQAPTDVHPKQDVAHASTGAPAAAGTGPVTSGGLYHTENPRQAPTDLEHPRHAPSPPAQHAADFNATSNPAGVKPNETLARNTAQEPGYNVLMSGTPAAVMPMSTHGHSGKHHDKTTQQPGDYNKLASGTPSGVDTTAPVIKDTHTKPLNPADHMIVASGLPSAHNPEKHQETTQQPGDYNHLKTGTPSGVAIDSANVSRNARSEDQPRAMKSDNYKHLATGTASGVMAGVAAQHHSARRASEGVNRNAPAALQRNESDGPYNKLSSGTPSGVKISPTHSRAGSRSSASGPTAQMTTEPVTHADHQDKDGVYRTLPSGTATGINVAAMHDNRDRAKEDIKHEIHEQSTMNTIAAHQAAQQAAAQATPIPARFGVARSLQQTQLNDMVNNASQPQRDIKPKATLLATEAPQSHYQSPVAHQPDASRSAISATVLPTSLHQHENQPEHKSQVSETSAIPTTTTQHRTQDQYKPVLSAEPPQQFMSPEVMPDAYTTSVPGRHSGVSSGPTMQPATTEPMRAKHMSPEVMPSAYTASAPGHSGAEKFNNNNKATTEPMTAKDMSPEVMPSAYTASAPGHSGAEKINHNNNDSNAPPQSSRSSGSSSRYSSDETGTGAGVSGVDGRVYPLDSTTEHASKPDAATTAATTAAAKHMSPNTMPAAYTASAPGHSGAEKLAEQSSKQQLAEPEFAGPAPVAPSTANASQNTNTNTQQKSEGSGSTSVIDKVKDKLVNPALAAASGAWAASSHLTSSGSQAPSSHDHDQSVRGVQSVQTSQVLGSQGQTGQQQQHSGGTGILSKPVHHKCSHCGEDNDISEVVEKVVRELKGGEKY